MSKFLQLLKISIVITVILLTHFDALAKAVTDSTSTDYTEKYSNTIENSSAVQPPADELYSEGIILPSNDEETLKTIIDKASSVLDKIKKTQNFIKSLNNAASFELPVGISTTIGGLNYDIAIHAIRLHPLYTEVDVFMQFEIPQNGKKLTFMATGIKFSKTGGIIGDAKLELVGNYAINFPGDKGQLVLKGSVGGTGGTFARMDCDGFRMLELDADVIFSRDLLIPENTNGAVQLGNVTASFQSTLTSWNDLLVEINLPNFQVTGLNGFGFSVNNAVFDFSDTRNALDVTFPKGYTTGSDPSLVNLWRGIYMRELVVRLPSQFKNNQNTSTTLAATNLLIDHQGVSGIFSGTNLIPLNNGDMNGWAFSVDSLAVSLLANQIQQAGFKGSVVVPVADQQNAFKYKASFGANDQYLFDVTTTTAMQFNIFNTSKVEIYKGSTFEVAIKNGKFLPKAILNGRMDIQAKLSEKGQGVNLADVKFENLQIQSIQPYIKVGNFSFGSDLAKQALAGFPISITKVSMTNITADQVSLNFNLKVNLVGESAGALAADGGLSIIGQLSTASGSQRWVYKDTQVNSIDIDIDQGDAFAFKGSLKFYRNDLLYGDGFNGSLDATFISKLKVKASAIFGNVNGERYWYADALVKFSEGIPFIPGVGFYGFGGGAYYHMKMDRANTSEIGKTASGVSYVPEMKNGLGLKAIVYIGSMPSEKAFSGDVTFQIDFFQAGGIHSISFTGNAYIATSDGLGANLDKLKSTVGKMQSKIADLESQAKKRTVGAIVSKITSSEVTSVNNIQGDIGSAAGSKGSISAHIFIGYDFENRTLHANLDVGINVAGGILTGGGDAVLHFSPEEWYVYIGTPDNRFSLSIGIGPIGATATSYFMVGSTIPGSPPPPPEVAEILHGVDLDYMKDLNVISQGGGFAFGASLSIKTGDITFLIFYANFSAGAGFDIMLKDYGNTYCEGSSSPIGINGWYANGQAYAYVTGEIGIKVNLFLSSIRVQILKIGAAVVLQAKLPNPVWMRGIVGGYFSVMGGLVSGQCSFQVTLGSECKLVKKTDDSKLKNIAVISQLTPSVGETEVNVFNNPQAIFNTAIDKEFTLDDTKYKISLDYFNLTSNGVAIPNTMTWNDAHTVAAMSTFDVLPPKKQIKSTVQVSFQKYVNGGWQKVLQDGQPITEKQEVTFTTGAAPDYIPVSNVAYSYPVIGQLNFYKDETTEGFIKLKQGQPYLFNLGKEWKQVGRFVDENADSKLQFDFAYNTSNATLTYKIPNASLKNNLVYNMALVNVPVDQNKSIDRNVSSVTSKAEVTDPNTDTSIKVKTQQAQGSIAKVQEKIIFSAYVRSSKYNTLASKVEAQQIMQALRGIRFAWRVHYLKGDFDNDEPYDKAELYGTSYTGFKPLLSFEADLSDNQYYKQQTFPMIYEGYPLDGNIRIKSRDEATLGVPPIRAVSLIQSPDNLEMDLNNPQYQPIPANQYYFYDLANYMYYDFGDIQQQVANRYLSQSSTYPRIEKILWGQFPLLIKGNYKINVRYTLPLQKTPNSVKQITLYNPIE